VKWVREHGRAPRERIVGWPREHGGADVLVERRPRVRLGEGEPRPRRRGPEAQQVARCLPLARVRITRPVVVTVLLRPSVAAALRAHRSRRGNSGERRQTLRVRFVSPAGSINGSMHHQARTVNESWERRPYSIYNLLRTQATEDGRSAQGYGTDCKLDWKLGRDGNVGCTRCSIYNLLRTALHWAALFREWNGSSLKVNWRSIKPLGRRGIVWL
jgi:hypothetical protein